MRENTLRTAMDKDGVVLATRMHMTWPLVTELIGVCGYYDYVEFLAEYAPFDHSDLENICRAAELHNLAAIIKVDYENRSYVAQKALASGFQGILFTDHTKGNEVKETIRSIRPASLTHKGALGFVNRRWIGCEELSSQQQYAEDVAKTVIGFMIEKKEAVDNIEEICQVDGVDFIQFGPADFAMNSGLNAKEDVDKIKGIERKVIATAIKYHVSPRVEIRHASEIPYYKELGVRHFALGTDLRILKDFWKTQAQQAVTLLKEER